MKITMTKIDEQLLTIIEELENRLKIFGEKIDYFLNPLDEYDRLLSDSENIEQEISLLHALEKKGIIELQLIYEDFDESRPIIHKIDIDPIKLRAYKRTIERKTNSKDGGISKLIFTMDNENKNGIAEYNETTRSIRKGTKMFAMLKIFSERKNEPFSLKDMEESCNPLIGKSEHIFKNEKDIDDTIREIRAKFGVPKKAYFPIKKATGTGGKIWKWTERSN